MKEWVKVTIVLGLCIFGMAWGILDCSPAANRQAAKTVLDLASVLCIVAHAESDDPSVQAACGIADELAPDMRRLLGAQREAARKLAASKAGCPK